jgi:hypothetical protein
MRPISVTVGPYAAGVANGICTSQTLAVAGPFTLNGSLVSGGQATLDNPRQVAITSSGNDSGVFITVSGYAANGVPQGETVRGGNVGTVYTNNFFKIVTGVSSSGPTSNVTVGTTTTPAASSMIRLDDWADAPLGVQVAVTGTVSFTVQHSFDDPNDLINPVPVGSMFWDTGLVPAGAIAGAAGITFSIAAAPVWMRLLLNSGSGSARMTVTQYQGGDE